MSELAAIGAQPQIAGFALAGARVYPADGAEQVRHAWRAMPETVAVVILTQDAADALGADRISAHAPLTVVMAQ